MKKYEEVLCYDDFEGSLAEFRVYRTKATIKIFVSENSSPWKQTSIEDLQWYMNHSSRVIMDEPITKNI